MDNDKQPVKKNRDKSTYALSGKSKDPEKETKKAEIFGRLQELHRRQGIAKFNSIEEMEVLIEGYFNDCRELQLRPTIRGLAMALGTVYETLRGWENGERDAQLGSQCSAIIKKSKQIIAEYDEIMAMEGLDNPILFMFRAKNYYNMKDVQEITLAPGSALGDQMTPEQILKNLPADIPVDVEGKELD